MPPDSIGDLRAGSCTGVTRATANRLGLLDTTTDYITQPDFPELYVSAHLPIPGTNGLDLKAGKYQDPMTAETLDPRTNVFYTHSYIANFGVPGNETGVLADLARQSVRRRVCRD